MDELTNLYAKVNLLTVPKEGVPLHIDPQRSYKVSRNKRGYRIRDEQNMLITIREFACAHLRGGDWLFFERD